jgi:hypothetical protein
VVEEQVALLSADEPEPLVCDHFLDLPLRHAATPSKKQRLQAVRSSPEPLPVKEDCGRTVEGENQPQLESGAEQR